MGQDSVMLARVSRDGRHRVMCRELYITKEVMFSLCLFICLFVVQEARQGSGPSRISLLGIVMIIGVWCLIADTLYHTDIRLEGVIANSLVAPFDQEMFWRDYSRIYEIKVFAPDVQLQCTYIGIRSDAMPGQGKVWWGRHQPLPWRAGHLGGGKFLDSPKLVELDVANCQATILAIVNINSLTHSLAKSRNTLTCNLAYTTFYYHRSISDWFRSFLSGPNFQLTIKLIDYISILIIQLVGR